MSDAPATPPGALPARQVSELRNHYLPVGAGTCTVVECPGANAPPMIIDCGSFGASTRGPTDMDEATAATAVKGILGNHSVQPNLVLSHGDKDHYGYLDSILDTVQVAHVWQGGAPNDYPSWFRQLLTTQEQGGATLHQSLERHFHNDEQPMGAELSCGDASVYILTVNSGSTPNGNSLMLSIEYGEFAAVFTGDAEASSERRAIQNFGGALKTTVLSGSHHGADTHGSNGSSKQAGGDPSEWPEYTWPEVVVYSHGRKYGHPRCTITPNYHTSLATVPVHPWHCGDHNFDNNPAPQQTTRAEYSTEVSGTITVTTIRGLAVVNPLFGERVRTQHCVLVGTLDGLLLGGSQSDSVGLKPYDKGRVLGYRWPAARAAGGGMRRWARCSCVAALMSRARPCRSCTPTPSPRRPSTGRRPTC